MTVLPDPTPDLVTAAWRELKSHSAELVAAGVGSDVPWTPYLFAWRVERTVNGSGLCSVMLSSVRAWAAPNRHNTARFPQLQVEVYADIDRDEEQGPEARTAQRKAEDVWKVIDAVFHRPDAGGLEWGDSDGTLAIVSSLRSQEPRIEPVPEADGTVRLTANYDVQLWG